EINDASKRLVAAPRDGHQTFPFDVGVKRLLTFCLQDNWQVEKDGGDARRDHMHASGLELDKRTGMADCIFRVGGGKISSGHELVRFGPECGWNVDWNIA